MVVLVCVVAAALLICVELGGEDIDGSDWGEFGEPRALCPADDQFEGEENVSTNIRK